MYPTDEELNFIRLWDDYKNYDKLMEYIKNLWQYADCGYWKQKDNEYYLSTAGWSGNEDIINALKENCMFWSFCWYESKRGGHYKFVLRI